MFNQTNSIINNVSKLLIIVIDKVPLLTMMQYVDSLNFNGMNTKEQKIGLILAHACRSCLKCAVNFILNQPNGPLGSVQQNLTLLSFNL